MRSFECAVSSSSVASSAVTSSASPSPSTVGQNSATAIGEAALFLDGLHEVLLNLGVLLFFFV